MSYSQTIALTGSDQVVRDRQCLFRGFTVVETGAAATATVRIYDNASAASGTLIAASNLAISGVDVAEFGVWCQNGIFVDVGGSGVVAGSIRIG